jgi:hypothetical protein
MRDLVRAAAQVQKFLAQIIAKQHRKKLDWRYIHAQLTPLAELKEDPQIVPKLKELRRIVESDQAG